MVPGLGPYGAILGSGLARVAAVVIWLVVVGCLILENVKNRKSRLEASCFPRSPSTGRERIAFLVAASLVVLVSLPLLTIKGHPYDMHSNQLWAYVSARYGLPGLYTTAAIATEGFSHGGDPYAAAAFPYPPLAGYFFRAAGEAYRRGGGGSWLGDPSLVAGLKLGYLSFHILGAFIGRYLLTRAGVPERSRIFAMLVYFLNPVLLWGAVVWGQLDTLLLLPLLVALMGIVERNSVVAGMGILIGATVKQTGLPFIIVLAALLVKEVGARDLLRGLARSSLWFFVLVAPLMWSGIHPMSFAYPIWRKVLQFGTVRWMELSNAVVARDGFNLWTLLTYFAGARGIGRMAFPDYVRLPWSSLSYLDTARVLSVGLVGYLGLLLFKRRQRDSMGLRSERRNNPTVLVPLISQQLLLVAAYLLGLVFLSTRITARYYTFGLAFLALAVPIYPGRLPWLAYCAASVSALVGMYGLMVQVSEWYPGLLPEFAAGRCYLNALVLHLYTSDGWISTFSALNLLAVIALLVSTHNASRRLLVR